MKKTIHLSIEKDILNSLKRRRANISRYVEKLILRDLSLDNNSVTQVPSQPNGWLCQNFNSEQNLGRAVFYFNSKDDKSLLDSLSSQKYGHDSSIFFTNEQEFFEFLKYHSFTQAHLERVKNKFRKHLVGKTFASPMELKKFIFDFPEGSRLLCNVIRLYLRYCQKYELMQPEKIIRYKDVSKMEQSRPDIRVPSNEDVIDSIRKAKKDPELELIYLVLATSGIRFVECLDFLKNYESMQVNKHEGFVSFSIGKMRNTKNINNIYIPNWVYEKLRPIDLNYDLLRKRLYDKGCTVTFKYLRKWNYNFLIYQGVPESVADFIQGRTSRSVGANHYLAKAQQAEFWYEKICLKFNFQIN